MLTVNVKNNKGMKGESTMTRKDIVNKLKGAVVITTATVAGLIGFEVGAQGAADLYHDAMILAGKRAVTVKKTGKLFKQYHAYNLYGKDMGKVKKIENPVKFYSYSAPNKKGGK